jgi:[mycofactocin precursor peptide]-tyrosine decarboxylase / 3-amino-5-[(4-hydroxyphenyl)methyl]-4,4-dimethylpyrrolidin-2-one synthase
MAAKFFTGLPLDAPDPECVHGHGERALAGVAAGATVPRGPDHGSLAGAARPAGRGVPVALGPTRRD